MINILINEGSLNFLNSKAGQSLLKLAEQVFSSKPISSNDLEDLLNELLWGKGTDLAQFQRDGMSRELKTELKNKYFSSS